MSKYILYAVLTVWCGLWLTAHTKMDTLNTSLAAFVGGGISYRMFHSKYGSKDAVPAEST